VHFRYRLHDVMHVLDDVDGANFIEAVVRKRQGPIQIGKHIRSSGVGVRIHSNRSRSLVEATTEIQPALQDLLSSACRASDVAGSAERGSADFVPFKVCGS